MASPPVTRGLENPLMKSGYSQERNTSTFGDRCDFFIDTNCFQAKHKSLSF